MNVLITGSEGFIGKNLANYISTRSSHQVFCPHQHELDLEHDVAVKDYLSSKYIDVIVHSATVPPKGKVYPDNVCERNLRMFFNITRGMSSTMRLINMGSGSEYSRPHWKHKMSEDYFDVHVPQDPHSYSKYVISKYITNTSSLDCVSLRLFGVFGKHEDYRFKFISNAVAKAISGLPIVVFRNALYDYVHVDDLCETVLRMFDRKLTFRDYNVTPTRSIELVDIARIVSSLAGGNVEVKVIHNGIGIVYTGANDRLRHDLGDLEFSSYENSIEALYQHYRDGECLIDIDTLIEDQFVSYAKAINS